MLLNSTTPVSECRIERDSLGEVLVPENALSGAQTQRAIENFPISGLKSPQVVEVNIPQLMDAADEYFL